MIVAIAIGAFVATFLGGLFALRYQDKLHLILGFSAGAVIGVAFFDLLPESIELSSSFFEIGTISGIIALGFVGFMILDRTFLSCHHHNDNCENQNHRGQLGAGSLSLHSFIDGLAVGLAFQVSVSVGLIVAIAVLTHNFSDGINTVGLILKNGGTKRQAFRWLAIDALAPVLGITVAYFLKVPEQVLGILLAIFCGSFFYIGASDLLPESHHRHPTHWTTFATVLGVAVLYGVIRLAGI